MSVTVLGHHRPSLMEKTSQSCPNLTLAIMSDPSASIESQPIASRQRHWIKFALISLRAARRDPSCMLRAVPTEGATTSRPAVRPPVKGRVRRRLGLIAFLLVGLPLLASACVFGRVNGVPWYEARRHARGGAGPARSRRRSADRGD